MFLKSSKIKRRHQLKAAETDATKPFRSPIYCCIFSQRCHSFSLSLSLSLLFLLLPVQVFSRISVLISFTVASFTVSLYRLHVPRHVQAVSQNGISTYIETSAGCYPEKWRLNNYTNRDPTYKRVHI